MLGPEERAILKETGSSIVLDALAMDTERAWTTLEAYSHAASMYARGTSTTSSRRACGLEPHRWSSRAGLDSRAYRFADALRGARVFELDLPQTRNYKQARVRDLFGSLPAHVTYAPIRNQCRTRQPDCVRLLY